MMQLDNPAGIVVQGTAIYIADCANGRVLLWEKGATSGRAVAGLGSAATGEAICWPSDIAIDSAGTLYVVDGGPRIAAFKNGHGTSFGHGQVVGPSAITIDAHDIMYVLHDGGYRIHKLERGVLSLFWRSTDGTVLYDIAAVGDGKLYAVSNHSSHVKIAAITESSLTIVKEFDQLKGTPCGIAIGPDKSIYVSFAGVRARVAKINPSGWSYVIVACAEPPDTDIGWSGLAADSSGVYAADDTNHQILFWETPKAWKPEV